MAEEFVVMAAQVPIFLAVAGIYYKQGKVEERLAAVEKLIVTRARFKR